MSWWVTTDNGTATGPFSEEAAWAERARLLRKSSGEGAAEIAVIEANSKTDALKYLPPMI
jgi:hypothetical protein